MLRSLRELFDRHILPDARSRSPEGAEHAVRLATAALLVEMARADFGVDAREREALRGLLARVFGLEAEETAELIGLAEREADRATSLYPYTSLINEHFSPEQKAEVIELLWEVAYADGRLDRYEDHLVRKVADLTYVPHAVFIRTKHQVRQRLGLEEG